MSFTNLLNKIKSKKKASSQVPIQQIHSKLHQHAINFITVNKNHQQIPFFLYKNQSPVPSFSSDDRYQVTPNIIPSLPSILFYIIFFSY